MPTTTMLLLATILATGSAPTEETVASLDTAGTNVAWWQETGLLADDLHVDDEVAADALDDGPRTVAQFGDEGTRRWTIQGGWGSQPDDSANQMIMGGIGYTHFIADDLSLNLELNGYMFEQEGDDAEGVNLDLLFRWHCYSRQTWSFYLDCGAGMLLTVDDVPADGSSFNFTPQAGAGFSFALHDDARLMVGARWHHVSNANTYDENPGRDSVLAYIGMSFAF